MRTVLFTTILAISAVASAKPYTIKKEDLSTKNFDYTLEYPVLTKGVVPAAEKINANLVTELKRYACDPADFQDQEMSLNYNVVSAPVSINSKYVTVSVSEEDDCGGAHPNNWDSNLTFDAKTGELIDFEKEVPTQNITGNDSNDTLKKWEKYNKALAKIVYKNLNKEGLETIEQCVDQTDGPPKASAVIEEIAFDVPHITGLAAHKKVIINTSPAHVSAVCALEVQVDFKQVKQFFIKNSKTLQWFK